MTDYASLKVPDLKKLLGERALPISGNKADLVARLQEDDGKKSGSTAPAAAAEDEIDWDEDDTTAAKPAESVAVPSTATPTITPATTVPAVTAVAAGGQGPIDTPVNIPNQKQDIVPATTHDLKVLASPSELAQFIASPEAEKKATSEAPATDAAAPAEPEKPKVDFSAGIELTDAEKEAIRRANRAKRFGIIEQTEEEKKLKERSEKFGGPAALIDETTIKTLNEGLPERRKRERKEQGGREAKRQTPDRGQAPKQRNEKKPPVPQIKQQQAPRTQQPAKKVARVLDDPVEKAKAEARASRFASK